MRPRDFALLLLSSGDLLPRQRQRGQSADSCGLALKRRLLEALAELDPEPADLDRALERLVHEAGPGGGPIRALALTFRDDWRAAAASPEWIAHLESESARHRTKGNGRDRTVPS
jgi:hypothetical protein